MTNPVGSTGPSPGNLFPEGANSPPPGPPLPPNNPWVKQLALLFPNVPIGELALWASTFQRNMFSAMNSEIQRCLRAAKRAARQFRESINR